jgi:hypothetical protein
MIQYCPVTLKTNLLPLQKTVAPPPHASSYSPKQINGRTHPFFWLSAFCNSYEINASSESGYPYSNQFNSKVTSQN